MPLPAFEHGRGETFAVDLVHALGRKPGDEAGAEMAARFDDDGVRSADVEAEHLEEHRVERLHAVGDDDHRHAADAQRGGGAKSQRAALGPAQAADDGAVVQADDLGIGLEGGVAGETRRGVEAGAQIFAPMPAWCAAAASGGSKKLP